MPVGSSASSVIKYHQLLSKVKSLFDQLAIPPLSILKPVCLYESLIVNLSTSLYLAYHYSVGSRLGNNCSALKKILSFNYQFM